MPNHQVHYEEMYKLSEMSCDTLPNGFLCAQNSNQTEQSSHFWQNTRSHLVSQSIKIVFLLQLS